MTGLQEAGKNRNLFLKAPVSMKLLKLNLPYFFYCKNVSRGPCDRPKWHVPFHLGSDMMACTVHLCRDRCQPGRKCSRGETGRDCLLSMGMDRGQTADTETVTLESGQTEGI